MRQFLRRHSQLAAIASKRCNMSATDGAFFKIYLCHMYVNFVYFF